MLKEAALRIAGTLEELGLPYAFIGGFALAFWGEPRLTADLDITLLADDPERAAGELLRRFKPRVQDPLAFLRQTRVLLLEVDGVPVDIAFAMPGYEEEALRRAVRVPLSGGWVRVLSPEDLIIHKCVAGRPRDLEDVRGILLRQRKLDLGYIRRWLREFEGLTQHSPLGEFEKVLGEVRGII